jgi:Cu-Zn family superoxide dismutase
LRRYTLLVNKRHKTQYVERKLSNKETNKKEKYVKGMKKNKDDFEKRYGKDAKAVMYATATKMAKASESLIATDLLLRTKKLAENVPNNNKIEIINDILSKPFPVGDLDLQFKAYLALPIPKMMTDFSKLKSAMGPEACARDIVRHYVKFRFPKSELEKVNLNESVQQQCPKTKASICSCKAIESLTEAKQSVKALCDFEHGEAKGVVYFKQKAGEPTVLTGYIRNLTPGLHGLHIHEFGDLSDGCDSAGAHYNPDGVDHGGIEAGHVGDLGNIESDQSGEAKFKIVAERVTLADVVGRALVVHADEDDLGKGGNEESLKTGNAGERSGCGVIRLMNVDETTTFENSAGNLALKRKGIQPKYYRNEMPQLKINHIMNPKFRQKHNLEYRRGKIGLDKIRPTQIDRIPGLADSAKKFFAQDNVEPFILDIEGNLVNGHHRYDAATDLGVKRVPVIVVNKHMDELVRLFPHTVSKTGKASDIKGFKRVAPVDVVDVSSDEYEKELARREINKTKADQRSISRQKQQRDAGQLELPFNNKKDKEPA